MKTYSIDYNTLTQLEEIKNNPSVLSYILARKPALTGQIPISEIADAFNNYKNICLKAINEAAMHQELKQSHVSLTELANKAGISVTMLSTIVDTFYKGTYSSLSKRGYKQGDESFFPKAFLVYLVEYVWNTTPSISPQLHIACLGLTPEQLFDRSSTPRNRLNSNNLLSLNEIGNVVQIDRFIQSHKLQPNWLIQLYRITQYYSKDGKDYLPVQSMDTPILDETRSKALFAKFPELLNRVCKYWATQVEVKQNPLDELVAQAASLAEQLEATLAKIKAMP